MSSLLRNSTLETVFRPFPKCAENATKRPGRLKPCVLSCLRFSRRYFLKVVQGQLQAQTTNLFQNKICRDGHAKELTSFSQCLGPKPRLLVACVPGRRPTLRGVNGNGTWWSHKEPCHQEGKPSMHGRHQTFSGLGKCCQELISEILLIYCGVGPVWNELSFPVIFSVCSS